MSRRTSVAPDASHAAHALETASTCIDGARVPFASALRFWLKLGCISFGGPAGHIAILHRELVARRRWIDETHFLHALSFCMVLPGPEAQQLATYIGWKLHGARGGLAAGALFVLPSALLLFALSWAYAVFGREPLALGALSGFKAVVVAILGAAVVTIGRRALRGVDQLVVAALAFAALHIARVPFPWIVLGAAVLGALASRLRPAAWSSDGGASSRDAANSARGAKATNDAIIDADGSSIARAVAPSNAPSASWSRALRIVALGAALWLVPFVAVGASVGWRSAPLSQYEFYTGAAFVTFGGAYAVLAYVLQAAVGSFGWISSTQALDGLALAETTPGPLIMVLQFVGFMTGWNHPGEWSPLASAALAAFLTTWATFVPSFVLVFLGAPYVELLPRYRVLAGALSGVTAAVLGVVLSLALAFGAAVLFPSGRAAELDVFALLLALAAALALTRSKLDIAWIVVLGGIAGLARAWLARA